MESQSAKVANYISSISNDYEDVNHIELCRYDLPFWDGEESSKYDDVNPWAMINHKIRAADALVLITPEWGGTASPMLKNFLLMCDQQDTAHKPALLVSVVSGISGTYPIAELRMNAFKNNKLVAIPDHLIVRNVEDRLLEQTDIKNSDQNLRKRIIYCLHMLQQYAIALMAVRIEHNAQSYPNQYEYRYGM
jgi:NAD(P)H-dependent FMN reductase